MRGCNLVLLQTEQANTDGFTLDDTAINVFIEYLHNRYELWWGLETTKSKINVVHNKCTP